jgi:hypothetical protein
MLFYSAKHDMVSSSVGVLSSLSLLGWTHTLEADDSAGIAVL